MFAVVVAPSARAQAVWDGGAGTSNWGTANNWNPNSVPLTTATVTFNAASANSQYTISLGGSNRTTAGITFASAVGSNAFTFSAGNTLTVNSGGITNNDADTQTFNVNVTIGQAQTWNAASGDLVFNTVNFNANLTLSGSNDFTLGSGGGSLTLNANRTLTNNSTGSVTIGAVGLSGNTLTAAGTGTTSVTGVISGTGALLKSGTGTLRLSGANTYSGTTTISQGTIIVDANAPSGSAGALGNATSAVTVNDGSTSANNTALLIGTSGVTIGRNVTVANSGSGTTTLGGNISSGTGTFTGNITLGRTTQFNADGTSTITFQTGTFSGTGGVTKTGTGTVVFNGSKGYSGTTTVNAGTLRAEANAGALGTGTLTLAGGELELANTTGLTFGRNTTVTGDATITSDRLASSPGAGVTHTLGTLSIGTNTLTLAAGDNVTSGTAGLTFGTTTTTGNATFNVGTGTLLTLGALGDGGSADTITKSGAGTLTLATAAGTITTGTAFNATAGTTNLNSATSLGTLTNVTLSTGATVNLGASQTFGALNGTGGTLNLDANTLTVGSTNNLSGTFDGSIAGTGSLVKAGTGTLTLTTDNTYSGTTTVNAGALNLRSNNAAGTGNITVNSNATLQIQNGSLNVDNAITLAGGTLQSVSGNNNQFGGNITLTNSSSILSSTAGQTLYIGDFLAPSVTTDLSLGANTLTVGGPGDITFNANVGLSGDTGSFISNSTGTVRFYGYTNYYQGSTTINSGTLLIDTDPNSLFNDQTIRGNLTIGNGVDAATVRFAHDSLDNRIANNSTITINQGSTLDLNSNFDTVGGLNLTGASITLGSGGTLQLTGDVTVGTGTSTITGYQFSMTTDNSTRNFNVASGGTLQIDAQVTTGNLVKQGVGTMILTGNNIYTGTTTVSDGILDVRSNTALGSTIGGTTVSSGGELQLRGTALTITGEALTLNGVGDTGPTGALRNAAGNNTWAGSITLGSNARINADSGTTLTASGSVLLSGHNLTVGGIGDTTISGVISNGVGTGTLTKDGTGTLTLTGNNNYAGATTIDAGVVNIRHNYALGSVSGGTTVASGAALQLENNITVGAEALSLSGTGVSNDGALRNISGNNTYGGAITVASASTRINSDSGTLTLTGTAALGGNTLTIGGTGNTTHTGQLTGTSASTLVKDGTGTLTLSNSTNTFAGNVNIDAGTLALGAHSSLNNSNIDVTIASGATLSLVQYAQSIGTLAGLGAVDFGTSGSLTLTGNTTFSGSFTGTGNLVVSSGITLTLGANFNATGVTIVLAGGTLDVNGSNSHFAGLTLQGNSSIDFDSLQNSTVRFTNLNLGSYTLDVYGWTDTQDYFYATNQPGTQGSPPLNQISFGPSGGPPWNGSHTTWIPYDQQVTPVPEPSTYGAMLMGAGLLFFGYRRWRQQRPAKK